MLERRLVFPAEPKNSQGGCQFRLAFSTVSWIFLFCFSSFFIFYQVCSVSMNQLGCLTDS